MDLKYRLIALDLDGTLTDRNKEIPERTLKDLIRLQEMGVRLVLASGRPAPGLIRESRALRMDEFGGYLMSYNGARVSDARDLKVLTEKRLRREKAVKLIRYARRFPLCIIYDDGKSLISSDVNGYKVNVEARVTHLPIKVTDDPEKTLTFDPFKILMSAQPEKMREIEPFIENEFRDLEIVRSSPFFLEGLTKGVSKGNALMDLTRLLGIDMKNVMAFGDEYNDVTMIENAGLGIAMGNGCDRIKEAADEVTLSNNEDGIAVILEKYFDI